MPDGSTAKEQLTQLSAVVDKLVSMTGIARDGFNRHRRQCLEELKNLQGTATQEINKAIQQLDTLMAKKTGTERTSCLRLHSILSHLHIIADNLGGLVEPLEKKIKDAVLFSDKAVSQINYLFDRQAGILRSLIDIVQTDNQYLKQYVNEESNKLRQACVEFATEHEARLIEGLCLPSAAPIFLAMLDRMRTIAQHELEIARLLGKQS